MKRQIVFTAIAALCGLVTPARAQQPIQITSTPAEVTFYLQGQKLLELRQ